MPSIRVQCENCPITFRSPKTAEYAPGRERVVTRLPDGVQKLVDPGRHEPRYVLCRKCYLTLSGLRRPSQPKRKHSPLLNRKIKTVVQPKADKKGKKR